MSVSREEVLDLLPDYLLGALDAETASSIDAYLDAQQDLLRQVRVGEECLALLALAAPPARPPVALKQNLLQRVEQDGRGQHAAVLLPAPPAVRTGTPARPTRWQMPGVVKQMVAVAAIVTLVALSGYTLLLTRQMTTLAAENQAQTEAIAIYAAQNADYALIVEDLRASIGELMQERDQLVSQTGQLTENNAVLNTRIQEINAELMVDQSRLQLLSTASEAVMLDQGEAAPESRGAFYVSGPQGILIVHGLTPLPESQVYQFWWVTPDGAQLPVTPIKVQADVEPTWAVFDVPPQAPPFSVVGLSIEPASGSPQPTGPMVLEGDVTG